MTPTPLVTILVLSLYDDLFQRFRHSVDILAPHTSKLLVRTGHDIHAPEDFHWRTIQGPDPFIYARNVNLGVKAALDDDVLLIGDDVRLYTSFFVETLQELAYSDPLIGIATPNLGQSPFVCGYIKRSVWDAVGEMDERFDGYGKDDSDWCRRMEALGYRTQTTDLVGAEHTGGTSYYRREHTGGPCVEIEHNRAVAAYKQKWGE